MDNFDLRKYLAEGKLLKEEIDYSSIKGEMKKIYDIDVDLDTIEDFVTSYNDSEGMDVFDTTEREDFYLYLKDEGKLLKEEISKVLNENEDTDIVSFLKSNKQELLSKLIKMLDIEEDEDDGESIYNYKIVRGANADGEMDVEIAGLFNPGYGEMAGLDFSFNPEKVKDEYGDAGNFKLTIAGKPVYGISYSI